MFRRSPARIVRIGLPAALGLLLASSALQAQKTGELPTAREVIDRSVKAMGGTAALKAVKSTRTKGKVELPDQNMSGTIETMSTRPNKLISKVTIPGMGNMEEAYDGKVAWSIDPANGPSLVTGKALAERADEAWFDAPLHASPYVKSMIVVGKEVFDKRPVYKLQVTLASGAELIEYFDVETGHQIGLEAKRETPLGTVPTRMFFREFKKFGDLTLPTVATQSVLGMQQVLTFTSYEFNTVPANAFDMPPVIKALIK